MLKNILIQAYFFLSYLAGWGQTAAYTEIGFLPEELKENSGMVYIKPNTILFINDSGNKPEVIVTDTLCRLKQRFCINGTTNTDWESLARDKRGNLYIGDFGNNSNNRKDLVIYKLEIESILTGSDRFNLREIHFTYEDQQKFPPEKERRNFDTEAMIHVGDSLYLFTKNRTNPFNGYTYCYRLPDREGTFVAHKTDSFRTGGGIRESHWITGADFREDPRTLLLTGYDKVWMFYYFEGAEFFSGKHSVLYFNNFTQKEAIAFYDDKHILFSEEKNNQKDGKLYKLKIPQVLVPPPSGNAPLEETSPDSVYLDSREFQDEIRITIHCNDSCEAVWEAFNTDGQRLHFGTFEDLENGKNALHLPAADWANGRYVLNIVVNGVPHAFTVRKPILLKGKD